MPIEGWRSLLETNWGDCANVKLHNLPFGFIETHEAKTSTPLLLPITPVSISVKVSRTVTSIYELQKSAAHWGWHDFKA
jgi:hypothetical protein